MQRQWRGERYRHFCTKAVVSETSLLLDVNDLKQEVANLQLLRDILANRAVVHRDDTLGSLVQITRAFYAYFRDGFTPPPSVNAADMSSSTASPSSAKRKRSLCVIDSNSNDCYSPVHYSAKQVAFLKSILPPTMAAGPIDAAGVPLMLEQWRRYTACFAFQDFTMRSFDVVTTTEREAIVRTRGQFTMHVTDATIAGIFPQLQTPAHDTLVAQIRDRVLVYPVSIDLYFDASGRVCRYNEAGGFVTAFHSIVRSPSALATLFHGALLWEAGIIGSLEALGIDDTSGLCTCSALNAPLTPSGGELLKDEAVPQRAVRKRYSVDFLLNSDDDNKDIRQWPPPTLELYTDVGRNGEDTL